MVTPDHFQVEYVINPHMEGQVGSVDPIRAGEQWGGVKTAYQSLGIDVEVIDGAAGFPDLVFCANQTLPGLNEAGERVLLLSNMASAAREPEVGFFGAFFADRGYDVAGLASDSRIEGCGDALWHHKRRLLWCGHGFRSDPEALESACEAFGVPGILLELIDPQFYHLDTCLAILTDDIAMWVPAAFNAEARALIERIIPHLIEVPHREAASLLACNAHSPDRRSVIIQSGCDETSRLLGDHGFNVIEVETGEFLKSGASVYCMKQMFY